MYKIFLLSPLSPPSIIQMVTLRHIMQGDSETPKAPLGDNLRPIQPLNQRYIRTNIDFTRKQVSLLLFFPLSLSLPLCRNAHQLDALSAAQISPS